MGNGSKFILVRSSDSESPSAYDNSFLEHIVQMLGYKKDLSVTWMHSELKRNKSLKATPVLLPIEGTDIIIPYSSGKPTPKN